MNPTDDFEQDLKRLCPRSISAQVVNELETRLDDLSREIATQPARSSVPVLASVWAFGFAIGAALMLLVGPWLHRSADPANPRGERPIAVVPDATSATVAVDPIDDPPNPGGFSRRLVLPANWRPEERSRLPARSVLTAGSELWNLQDLRDGEVDFERTTDFPSVDAAPQSRPAKRPRVTRQELIHEILNEA